MLTRRRLIVVAVLLAVIVLAWWKAPPLVAGLLSMAAVVAIGFAALPASLNTEIHGPGYQYRDDTEKRR